MIQNPSEAQRKEHDKFDFGLHEVYGIDVLISTGEGQVEMFILLNGGATLLTLSFAQIKIQA